MDSGLSSIQSPLWTYAPVAIGVVALLFAVFFYFRVKGLKDGDENMNRIAGYIREGSMAFLMRATTLRPMKIASMLTWPLSLANWANSSRK